jgi:hypothetical protein
MAGYRSTVLIFAEDRMAPNRQTKVLLADDHTMFREGLAGILASYGGLEVVAGVPNDARVLGSPGSSPPTCSSCRSSGRSRGRKRP